MAKKVERDKQETLPGVVPKPTKALLSKVEDLEAVRYKRMALQEEEAGLEKIVLELMHKQGVETLGLSSGRKATLATTPEKEKVKFSTPKEP